MGQINPTIVAKEYKKVISAFKKRYDVQNGTALGYRQNQDPNGILLIENKPKGIGDGLTTTGWCVSASQSLLLDPIFQILIKDRGAYAKLISIDIREQYYGATYSGNQNKWHTAILVHDSGINFVIDITCPQFGNAFNNKDIWDFCTWEKTFRNPADKHIILDFFGNELNCMGIKATVENKTINTIEIVNRLHNITSITDEERNIIADFFLDKINIINKKLIIGNINKFDYKYLDKINKLLKNLDFKTTQNKYLVLEFPTKDSALKYIDKLIKNDFILEEFLLFSDSIEKSCITSGINIDNFNKESQKNKTYISFCLETINGYDISFINENLSICLPYGIKLYIDDIENDIYNGGKILNNSFAEITKKTNTIYIKCSN